MTDYQAVVQGVDWDLTGEYPAADSPEIDVDLKEAGALLTDIERRNDTLVALLAGADALTVELAGDAIAEAREIFALLERVRRLVQDPETYAECCLSVDSQDEPAQALLGRLQTFNKRLEELAEPLGQFLDLSPEPVIDAYLADPAVAPSRFNIEHSRGRRHELLPLAEENLITALGEDGIHAWGRLYDQLSGTLSCAVTVGNERRDMGVAEAAGLMQQPDDRLRENAWRAINEAWDGHVESCAAAINAIAGWRLELCRKRTSRAGTGVHYLHSPLHANRIQQETLDTVLQVAEEGIPLARRAARLQAKAYGKQHYGPWDNRAPAPTADGESADPIGYDDALDLIAEAYGEVEPEMGDFVRMMADRQWIEGTVGPRKRPGAYCTGFLKSRTPRVYMTYSGGSSDVITLAHELGHAFHSWVMRDLPDSQQGYGMSIAETASTFGETIVRDALLRRAESPSAAPRYRLGGSHRAGGLHPQHPHPVRVRAELLRRPRRTAAATKGTQGHDERGLGKVVRGQHRRRRSDVLGEQASLLHLGVEFLQLPVSLRLPVQPRRLRPPGGVRGRLLSPLQGPLDGHGTNDHRGPRRQTPRRRSHATRLLA